MTHTRSFLNMRYVGGAVMLLTAINLWFSHLSPSELKAHLLVDRENNITVMLKKNWSKWLKYNLKSKKTTFLEKLDLFSE